MIGNMVLYLVILGILSLLYIRNLKKRALYKEIITYIFFMLLAAWVGSLMILNIRVPNPTNVLEMVFDPIGAKIIGQ